MVTALEYLKFSDDLFMLKCRPEVPQREMPDHPIIQELDSRLDEVRTCDHIRTGMPYGPLWKVRAWAGCYTIGSCEFQIKAMYAYPKIFGLMCDTEDGTHNSEEIQRFVDEINEAVAADLGVESLG